VLPDTDRLARLFLGCQAILKDLQRPPARMRERFRAGRVEEVFSKVSPQETPNRAIESKTNISLIAGDNFLSSRSWWAVRKSCTILDQGLVS